VNRYWAESLKLITICNRVLAIALVAEVVIVALLIFLAWAIPAIPDFSFYPVFAVATPLIWLLQFILGPLAVLAYWITPWRGFWQAAPFNLGIASLFCAISLNPAPPLSGAAICAALGVLCLGLLLKGGTISKRIGLALTLGLLLLDRHPATTFWAPLAAGVVFLVSWGMLNQWRRPRGTRPGNNQSA
jgi:hypothetical protein